MKYEGAYACTWSMFENGGNHGGTDFSFLDGNGLTPRASFRHMEMIAKNFSGNYADGTCAVPKLVTFGCYDAKTNKVCAMLINRTGQAYDYTLRFDSLAITAAKTKININAGIAAEYSDNIGAGNTIMLVFTGGNPGKKYTYTAANFNAGQPPVVSEVPPILMVGIKSQLLRGNGKQQGITCRQSGTGYEINLPSAQSHTVAIVGMNGRVVKGASGVGARSAIDAGSLPSGVYCLQVKSAEGAGFSKIINIAK
jgi:hypothetical protein